MPFCFNLKVSLSCQTSSKVLDMSMIIPWVIDKVDTGITGLETRLFFRDEFISGEIDKYFVKNKSFKYFTTNQK